MPPYLFIYYAILLAGILIGSMRFRQLTESMRWMLFLLIGTLLSELVSYLSGVMFRSNLIVFHFFAVIQFLLISRAYYAEIPRYKRLLIVLGAISLVAGMIDWWVLREELMKVFPAKLSLLTDTLTVLVCLLYLRELINSPTEIPFFRYPMFWISLGWLLFITLTTVGLGTFNYVSSQARQYHSLLFAIRVGANYQLYFLYIVAFLTPQRYG